MNVASIDYGSGNLHSALKAFERAANDVNFRGSIGITHNPSDILSADRIVLPGVGAFADCRRGLDSVPDLTATLKECVKIKKRPFMGICVGMQLLATRGLEHEITSGLGWIDGDVVEIQPTDPTLKIPHMGWNTLSPQRDHALLKDISTGDDGYHAYFVHSYHFQATAPEAIIATSEYGGTISAIVGQDNIVGTQFHPEKSQRLGLAFIGNFLRWNP